MLLLSIAHLFLIFIILNNVVKSLDLGTLHYRNIVGHLIIRNFLLGRKHTLALRAPYEMASRSPPQPNLPDGPHHKLFANYYYTHDARSEVKPPVEVAGSQARITAGTKLELPKKPRNLRSPGPVFHWD